MAFEIPKISAIIPFYPYALYTRGYKKDSNIKRNVGPQIKLTISYGK